MLTDKNRGPCLLHAKRGRSLAGRNHIDDPTRQTTIAEHYFEGLPRAIVDYERSGSGAVWRISRAHLVLPGGTRYTD